MTIQETILQQLGGARFQVMTGAKAFLASGNCLTFTLPSRFAKDGINRVTITLEDSDTYTVEFQKVGPQQSVKAILRGAAPRGPVVTTISRHELVYAEDLRRIFTQATGLEVSLGTMGMESRPRC